MFKTSFSVFKKTILFVSLLLLSACHYHRECTLLHEMYDYFYCIKEYYTNVVLHEPDNYPEFSFKTEVNKYGEEFGIISYKGEYKLDEVTDGFDAEREYSINFYEDSESPIYYYSTDTGFVKNGSSYERQDYSFTTRMMVDFFNECDHVYKKSEKAKFRPWPTSKYFNSESGVVDNELTKKMSEKVTEIMTNCLKVIDKYCRDNNKGLYAGGYNKGLDLFAK